ncbi:MAG: HD domain-containing protein [bacterium]|nr:HD domain-containing protein [bacterium]
MDREIIAYFRAWFSQYVATFSSSSAEQERNIILKKEHTLRVCQEILSLGHDLGLTDQELFLAEAAALFHDLGRFRQWQQYGTFRDDQSENHALLALRVLDEHKLLAKLSPTEQELIRWAIQYHNTLHVPEMENLQAVQLTRLLRDADKLDIFRVFLDHFHSPPEQKNFSVEWNLPDTDGYSEAIWADLSHHRISSLAYVRNRNDFKLLLLGWVFDINFLPTVQRILERKYVEEICRLLPPYPEIRSLEAELLAYLRRLIF